MYFENILTMTTMASIIKSGCRYRFTILHVKGKKKRQRTQIYSDMREGTVQSIENSIQHTSRGLIDHKSSHSNFLSVSFYTTKAIVINLVLDKYDPILLNGIKNNPKLTLNSLILSGLIGHGKHISFH